MMVCQTVIDNVADHNRRNVEGQIDLFGISDDNNEQGFGGIELPDIPEYSKGELTRMEREVTGLYLSGHPMDEFRSITKRIGAANIGDILADFAGPGETVIGSAGKPQRFKDNQKVVIAGVIESVKTKPTRNNSLMAYLTVDDGTGNIEMLAFQKVLDDSGVYMQVEAPVLAYGRISERDDKDPQIVLDTLRPITDAENIANRKSYSNGENAVKNDSSSDQPNRTLYVKIKQEDSPEYQRLKKVHMMFPGRERMVIHFENPKKNVGASCVIHEAFVDELNAMLGKENVVVR